MNRKQKALVILTPGYPAGEEDSTCLPMQRTFVGAVAEQFPSLQIFVLSFQYPYRRSEYSIGPAKVYSFNGRNKGGIFKLMLRRKIFRRLDIIHEAFDIRGIISFWYGECAVVGYRFARLHALQHICWILGQDARPQNRLPSRVKLPPQQLAAISDFIKAEFERNHGVVPMHVVPPGVDLKMFSHPNRQRDIDILAAGSLIPLKQVDIFLEVVSVAKKKFPSLRCVIIGDGPEKEKIMDLIVELDLRANVFMAGELSYEKVLECMSRTRVLLHTSSYEGFSGVCMEALAAGAHVISFCRAMDHEIDQWQIVGSKEEMIIRLFYLLQNNQQKNIFDFPIEATAWQMMELLGESPNALELSSLISAAE